MHMLIVYQYVFIYYVNDSFTTVSTHPIFRHVLSKYSDAWNIGSHNAMRHPELQYYCDEISRIYIDHNSIIIIISHHTVKTDIF